MGSIKIIGLAADHAGYQTKEYVKEYLGNLGFELIDFGTNSEESADYPDFAHPLAKFVEQGKVQLGISICGSGNGISMVVNKYPKIRAALCWNAEIAKLAVEHNNANICSIPARFVTESEVKDIIESFLKSKFEGGRHQKRIDKIPIS